MGKYKNTQFRFSLKEISVLLIVLLTTVLSLVFYGEYSETKEKYNIEMTQVDYIIQTPSTEQIIEMKEMEHIAFAVPYYFCACNTNHSGRTVRAELYLIEDAGQMKNTLFSDKLLVEQDKNVSGNVVYIDSVFAKEYALSVGDDIQFQSKDASIDCVVGAVYETDGRHDKGMLMAIYEGQFADFVNPTGALKYSGAYIGSSDVVQTKMMLNDYVPLGDLRARDEFESEEIYQAYLDLKMSAESAQTTFNKSNYLKEVANRYDAKLLRNSFLMYAVIVVGACLIAAVLLGRSLSYIKKDMLKDIYNNFSMEQEKEMFRTYFMTVAAVITAGNLIAAVVMIVLVGMAYSIGVVLANVLLPLAAVMIVWFVAVLSFKKLYYKAA